MAQADRFAELPVEQPRVAPGPQRLLAQDPGFLDVVVNKKPAHVRVYLPPDANTLLSRRSLSARSQDYVNVIVAGKQPLNWLSMDEAIAHCTRGVGMWPWASTDDGGGTPTWSSPVVATSPRSRPLPRRTSCAASCPISECAS